jgi:MFS family permease
MAKKSDKMKWLLRSQSIVLFGTGLVFPFYIIFIREIGANFTEFGIAYALFALSSAFVHKFIGNWSDKIGRKVFLLINSWGTAILFLIFPIVTTIFQVYVLQVILGIFGAMHKTCEKTLVGDFTDGNKRGKQIGVYHGWIAIFSALAIVVGGYLIDFFTLAIIFYIGSVILFLSGFAILKIKENK